MRRRNLLTSLITGVAALPASRPAAGAQGAGCGAASLRDARRGRFPNVILTDQYGQKARFYDDLIRGRIVVVNFFYTHCEERCPLYTANLVKVQRLLGDRAGRDIFFYSISLDPGHDTPQALKEYADKYHVRPGWSFLTGSPADVELVRRRLKFTDPDPEVDKQRTSHLGMIRYGNDRLDRWSACAAMATPAEIVKYMSWLEPPEMPAGKRSPNFIRRTASDCVLLD